MSAAEVRLAGGASLATYGPDPEAGLRFAIGTGDELLVAPTRPLVEEELSFVRAVAHTLATALARLRDEERMRHEAVHDPLTGLANRTLLRDRLEHALARSERETGATAVLFVDLDNFKRVNDAHGHAAGDAALVELGRRLQTAVRPGDTIARIGGDEFVALCEDVSEESALAVGRRLLEAIRLPFTVRRRRTPVVGQRRDRARPLRSRRAARQRRRRHLPRQGRRARPHRAVSLDGATAVRKIGARTCVACSPRTVEMVTDTHTHGARSTARRTPRVKRRRTVHAQGRLRFVTGIVLIIALATAIFGVEAYKRAARSEQRVATLQAELASLEQRVDGRRACRGG